MRLSVSMSPFALPMLATAAKAPLAAMSIGYGRRPA